MAAIFMILAICVLFNHVSAVYKECPHVNPPENGSILYYKTYYVAFCNSGYSSTGATHIICKDGQWEFPPPRCIKKIEDVCPDLPLIEHGTIHCQDGPLSVGKACWFSCDDGYILKGVNAKLCMSDLRWIRGSTKCVPKSDTCPDLYAPENGIIHCREGPLVAGKTCWFQCSDGYTLSGVSAKLCKSDLQWTPGFTECIPTSAVVTDDGPVCADLQVPQNGIKECDRPPLTAGKRCRFTCKPGYKFEGIQWRACMADSIWSGRAAKCISERAASCNVPPELKNGRVVNCSPNRIPVAGQTCSFQCNQGYVLKGPHELYCRSNGKLTDIHGKEDLPECIDHSLQNRNDESTGGWPNKDKTNGVNRPPRPYVSPCSVQNGGCEHKCIIYRGQPMCKCPKGYTLDVDGKHCKDIDECSSELLHRCNHICTNKEGGYDCSCFRGHIQIDKYKCIGCRKNSYWSVEVNACVDCPENSYTDSEAKISIDDCICKPGFTGDPRNNIPCEDINECANNNFNCSHLCINLQGSAYCSCNPGYAVDNDNKTCVDIDECSLKNGGCQGRCVNTDGDFYCICPEGFSASNKDRYTCDDIDECLDNNGGCEQKCINYPGGYYCACESGFRIDAQLKNCTNIVCPSVPLPNYSKMTCKKEGNNLPISDSYPVGTVCRFDCLRGYKSTTELKNIQCLQNKEWKGTVPECKAQQCKALSVPENGDVHPSTCARHGIAVKQRCTFTCNPGYILVGKPVFTCNFNLSWSVKETPVCEKIKIQPFLSCPLDITETLLPDANTHNVTIPEPSTNLENYTIAPDWVITGKPVKFPAGVTRVFFSARNPNTNGTKRCSFNVHILDKEPPVFYTCPDPILIEGASGFGTPVSWEEPFVTDNVEVKSVISSLEPNTTLTPGTYMVEYIAKDGEGNIASCSFDINITRSHCSDLNNQAHGEANCMDWIFGKVCNPICDPGYMRNPDDPSLYSCGDSGLWDPTDKITDCLKYIPPVFSACPKGYELKINAETEEEACMENP